MARSRFRLADTGDGDHTDINERQDCGEGQRDTGEAAHNSHRNRNPAQAGGNRQDSSGQEGKPGQKCKR